MKVIQSIFLFSLLFLLYPSLGFACMCRELPIEKRYQNSDLIFLAKVQAGESLTLQVLNLFKGIAPIGSHASYGAAGVSSSCDARFQLGKTYVVFAKSSMCSPGVPHQLEIDGQCYLTSQCSGNVIADEASEVLQYLESASARKNI
jgi:hypothetical protein